MTSKRKDLFFDNCSSEEEDFDENGITKLKYNCLGYPNVDPENDLEVIEEILNEVYENWEIPEANKNDLADFLRHSNYDINALVDELLTGSFGPISPKNNSDIDLNSENENQNLKKKKKEIIKQSGIKMMFPVFKETTSVKTSFYGYRRVPYDKNKAYPPFISFVQKDNIFIHNI